MLSKALGWIFGGKDSVGNLQIDSDNQKTDGKMNNSLQNINPGFNEESFDNQDSSWRVTPPQQHRIPKSLQSAFDQPDKSKKPFSYFAPGQTPDLTNKPSPKEIRRANPVSHGPPTPKVLPIVSESDLKDFFNNREKFGKIQKPVAMSALTNSSQYNTPIALYSKDTLNKEMRMQQNHVANSDHSFKSMNNYHASETEECPRYPSGFHVKPKSQSPCFKRLQYATGLHTDSEDEPAVEVKPSDVRMIENGYHKMTGHTGAQETANRNVVGSHAFHHQIEPPTITSLQPQTFHGAGHTAQQKQPQQERVRYDQPNETTIEDPVLLAKIMAAERSKIPAPVVPEWTRQAALKSEKWRGYAEYQDSHRYEGPAVPPAHLASPAPWQTRRSPAPFGGGSSTLPRSIQPKSRFVEPQERPEKEHWMKPFVASNVVESKFTTPLTVRTSIPTPAYKIYSPVDSSGVEVTKAYDSASAASMHYQSTPAPYSMTTSWTAPKIQEQQAVRQPSAPRYTIETTYSTPLTPKLERRPASRQSLAPWTPVGSAVGGYKAPVSGVGGANLGVYQHEQEAYEKMKELEREVARKSSETQKSGVSPGWKPVPSQRGAVVPAGQEPVAISQQWQDANGASTKSQTTGSYLDNEGNVVHYVKEVYTSSDPGKEFSMLSQQERKVLEEPLEPGVVARHTTTKYYKKSTFTSSSTTSASQSTPAIAAGPSAAPARAAVTLPAPRHSYKTPIMETTY